MAGDRQQGSLFLIGATARTGRLVIKEALDSGFKVTALARRPEALADVAGPQVRRHLANLSAPLIRTGKAENESVICMHQSSGGQCSTYSNQELPALAQAQKLSNA